MIFALAGLFAAAFIAATLLPFNSEVLFVGLQIAEISPVWVLVVVAAAGNTLGAFVNYWVGLRLEVAGAHRWMRLSEDQFNRAHRWWDRWGYWSLLLSWVPILELTTVIAGAMRMPLLPFGLLVGFAKTARYIGLAAITAGLFG